VKNLTTGVTELISARQPGSPAQAPAVGTTGRVFSFSADARYIAFSDTGTGLLAGGYTNLYRGVFVRDQLNGTNVLASVDTNGLGGADNWSFDPAISGDGRYVAFTSAADNLVPNDTNQAQDVFVRDLQSGTTTLVSINSSGTGPGNAASYSPVISTNGRCVLFLSQAGNLASGTPIGTNLFWRDLQLGTTHVINTASIGTAGSAYPPAVMTPDGRFVAFLQGNIRVWDSQSAAVIYNNASGGQIYGISPDGNRIAYYSGVTFTVTDRRLGSNWLIRASIPSHAGMQFSADSRYLVFATTNSLVANDLNRALDVYLFDCQTQSNQLISVSSNLVNAANGIADSPAISPDGRFIAYRSSAGNIIPGPTNGLPNIYVYDRQTGTTSLVSPSAYGNSPANSRSLAPAFSADSQTLVFQSWSSDLTTQAFNQGPNLFALKLYSSIATPVFVGQVLFVPASAQSPTLTWPVVAGWNYQVQFKNNLADAVWQNLNTSVTIAGGFGSVADTVLSTSQRFYRVVASAQ
jgi:Tol biopolymer transport system component